MKNEESFSAVVFPRDYLLLSLIIFLFLNIAKKSPDDTHKFSR